MAAGCWQVLLLVDVLNLLASISHVHVHVHMRYIPTIQIFALVIIHQGKISQTAVFDKISSRMRSAGFDNSTEQCRLKVKLRGECKNIRDGTRKQEKIKKIGSILMT